MTIKWDCKKQGCHKDKVLADWSMLDGCFDGTRVTGSDIDGIVHQNGKCLFLEKKFPNGFIAPPQMRCITTLVYQGNSFIVFWCEKPDGSDISSMRVFGIAGYHSNGRFPATLKDLRGAVKAWWQTAYQAGKV